MDLVMDAVIIIGGGLVLTFAILDVLCAYLAHLNAKEYGTSYLSEFAQLSWVLTKGTLFVGVATAIGLLLTYLGSLVI